MTMKLYVEIPHRRPAIAYFATDSQMIEFACKNESEYLDQNYGDEKTTIEQAIEAIGHDLSGLLVFNSKQEAIDYFKQPFPIHGEESALKAIYAI